MMQPADAQRYRPIRDPLTAARLGENAITPGIRRRFAHAVAMGDISLPGRDEWLQAIAQRLYRNTDTVADRQSLAHLLANGELLGRR